MTVRDLTAAFNKNFRMNKTEGQIKFALQNHKIRCGRAHKDRLINRLRLFTSEQIDFLKNNYPGRTVVELRILFNAEFNTKMTRQQIKSAVQNRGIVCGRTGQYEKGHKPWNHGTKGQGLTGANRGSFKKGNVPPNRKPLGSERICSKDGYVYVKVAERDPYTDFPTRYKLKHVHTWEQKNGPVPDGYVVIFKDGNKLNCDDPDNLVLVSRAELLMLNRFGYKDAPDAVKSSILALSKLKVEILSNEKSVPGLRA